ncbi:hypothetical protein SAMN06297129_2995 [Pseudooceanicola antarcticus]|uniref:Lipoprotein n=1 Tax=Pseudooceanicola antarcticus TaxID=1247613 RepID=A0A285J5A7_9RHOB|nr:hypothetical protein [Pseudooceanicola antarcticus]PJE26824.1 hypothetical protein CVM39_15925 [Pseudooceanicola antarcticus]SNY55392.1 hypothetical protein SAMN06297129_2995 [Pseudooceanicola antarcticus]
MRFITLATLSVLALTACAKKPDQIAAVEMSDDAYRSASCRSLAAEELKITQELANLSAKQQSAANGDAWGVFLLGLPVSSMSGNDQEAMIAIAKGKLQSIDRAQAAKGCS